MPKLQIVAGVAIASAIGVSLVVFRPQAKSQVTVTVNNFNGGVISGARVQLGAQVGTTNSSGKVVLSVVYGTRTLSASASGFTTKSQSATINQSVQSLSITLSPVGSLTTTIALTVIDSVTHAAISGALYTINGNSVQTNSSGKASIMVPYGTYTTSTVKVGYNSLPGSVICSQPNQSVNQSLVPISSGGITVTLTSTPPVNFLTIQTATVKNNGVPVVNQPVTYKECQQPGCTTTSGSGYHTSNTDSNGQVIVHNTLPSSLGAHLYRDWIETTIGGVLYRSLICQLNTTASGGGTVVCGL